jgi:hypothetical protein
MHAGTRQAGGTLKKSKTEAMYFPASPNSELDVLPEPFDISALHHIHFTSEFCYLGSFLTTDLRGDDLDMHDRHHPHPQIYTTSWLLTYLPRN